MVPKLKFGVVGLGRAFSLMAGAFRGHPRVALVAGADPRPEARARLAREFHARAYATAEELCADSEVDVVYVATPHHLHAAQACLAASHNKHVLVEKPMALTLEECRAMIGAARAAGVQLMVGHSHSYDAPIRAARRLIASGALGAVRMVSALNYTDFLYRPRRPEELDTKLGGGVVFNQAAHQVDVVRALVGSEVTSVRACTGAWDPARPTEGAYSALLTFDGGAFASLVYSGYARFDSDELLGWIGESGALKDANAYGTARRALQAEESALKRLRNYGGPDFREASAPAAHAHFGMVVVSCEHADLRPLPTGLAIYGDAERRIEALAPPPVPRAEVIDEVVEAVVEGKAPLHDGEWAMRTLAVCLAILRSGREAREAAP